MRNFFKNLPYSITKSNKARLANYDQYSNTKVYLTFFSILLPAILWMITGFLVSNSIYNLGITTSLIVSAILFTIVFITDWLIVSSAVSNGWGKLVMFITRGTLACFIAILGGLFLDTVLFSKDINHSVKEAHLAKMDSSKAAIGATYQAANKEHIDELNGKGSRFGAGDGKVAKEKKAEKDRVYADMEKAGAKAENEAKILNDENNAEYNTKMEELGLNSLSKRLEAFDLLKNNNEWVGKIWLFILIVTVTIEIIPILLKLFLSKSSYEKDEEAREKLMDLRRQEVIANASYYAQLTPAQQRASKLLRE